MNQLLSIPAHHYHRARRLIRARQYAAALQPLGHLEGQSLSRRRAAAVQHLLGVCSLRLHKRRRAARHFRAAIRLSPTRPLTHALLGRVAPSPTAAREHYLRAAELKSNHSGYLARAGLACVRAGDHDAGLRLLREAAELDPTSFGITRRLVLGLVEAGLPDEAEQALVVARFASPRCGRLRGLLGKLRCGQIRSLASPDANEAGPQLLPFLRLEGLPTGRDTSVGLSGPHLVRLPRRYALGQSS